MDMTTKPNDGIGINDVTDLLRRRSPMIAAVFLAVVLATIAIAFSFDDLYASTGRIDIEEADKSISMDPVAEHDRELRISRIYDSVMSRDKLAPLVEKYNLYPELRGDSPAHSVVWQMRPNIELDILRKQAEAASRDPVGPVIGLAVTFYNEDPRTAKNVARELQDMLMDENIHRQQTFSDQNILALEQEKKRDLVALENAYQALTQFKMKNPGAMPEDTRRVQSQIDRKEADLVRVDEELRRLDASVSQLRAQLSLTNAYLEDETGSDVVELQSEYIRLIGLYGPEHPDVIRVKRQLNQMTGDGSSFLMRQLLESQLADARRNFDEVASSRNADHPDYQAAWRRVASLEREIAALPVAETTPPTNPVYVNTKLQLDAALREVGAQRARRGVLEREISELESNIVIAPEVQQELAKLEREIELLEEEYRAATKQLEQAIASGSVIGRELNEFWRVAKVPTLPFVPAYPNRPLYIAIGIFLGLTLGVGVGLVAEALDGTIRSTRDVRHVMQMPPIAAIPVIKTQTDVRRDRFRRLTVAAVVLVAVGAVGLYVRLQTIGAI